MEERCSGCTRRVCNQCRRNGRPVICGSKVKTVILPEAFGRDAADGGGGVAFDIGTTTVGGILWNLSTGRQEAAYVANNPQGMHGGDVVSRIAFALVSKENQCHLQQLIIGCLNGMLAQMQQILPVHRIVIVGNPAMCHLVAGLSPAGLARAPFVAAYEDIVVKTGADLGLLAAAAQVFVLPGIGGHVGADMLSALTYVDKIRTAEDCIVMDIGTNGEIALIRKHTTYVCSAAAGPALEGGAVTFGMSAAAGAIMGVRWCPGASPGTADLALQIIGGGEPLGICGSGLISLLAVMLEMGVIDKTGYLFGRTEAVRAGVAASACRHLVEWEGEHAFLVYQSKTRQIVITAADIRQLQLSKGAIRAAVAVLLKKNGLKESAIPAIYLAGAFGSVIPVKHAIKIGLLPDIAEEKIHFSGNAAGAGASMALLSAKTRRDMTEEAGRMKHLELAEEEMFQSLFIQYMAF